MEKAKLISFGKRWIRRFIAVLILIVFNTHANHAQKLTDTLTANKHLEEAGYLVEDSKYDSAIVYYKKAAGLYEEYEAWNKYIQSLHGIGESNLKLSKHDTAMFYFEKALSHAELYLDENDPDLANSYFYIGKYLREIGAGIDALEYQNKAFNIRTKTLDHYLMEDGVSYFEIGNCFWFTGEYDKAISCYNKALDIQTEILGSDPDSDRYRRNYRDNPDYLNVALTHRGIGFCYIRKGNNYKALTHHKKAHEIQTKILGYDHSDVADSYNNIADYYMNEGNYDLALEYHHLAYNIWIKNREQNQLEIATIYNNIGLCHKRKGNNDRALEYYQKTVNIYIKITGQNHVNVATTYHNIGQCHWSKGNYDLALEYYHKALNIRTGILGPDHVEIAPFYNAVGKCYARKRNYDKALDYHRRALNIQTKTLGYNNPAVATTYYNIANCYWEKRNYDRALEYYNKGLNIRTKTLGHDHLTVSDFYDQIGSCYYRKRHYDLAMEHHNKALNIRVEILGDDHPKVASSYNQIGADYWKKGNYDDALAQQQKALMAVCKDFKDSSVTANPVLIGISSKLTLLSVLRIKANVLSLKYTDTNNTDDLELAFSTNQLAISLIDSLRFEITSADSRQDLMDKSISVYDNAITQAFHRYKQTQKKDFLHHAFSIAEKSRAFLLLEGIKDSRAKQFANIPDSLVNKENDLKTDISFYEKKLFELEQLSNDKWTKQDSTKLTMYQDYLFDRNREFDQFIALLEKDYPQYYKLKYDLNVASVEDVQNHLKETAPNTAFLSFFAGDSTVTVFIITADNFYTDVSPVDTSFYNRISELRNALTDITLFTDEAQQAFGLYSTNAVDLYNILLKEAMRRVGHSSIQTLVIIPDGPLGHLPFDVLLTASVEGQTGSYRKLPYLIRQYAISYYQSATLFMQQQNMAHIKRNNNYAYLGFAPTYADGDEEKNHAENIRSDLSPLYHNKEEVQNALKYFNGKIFLNEGARETNFKKHASDASILHLAMHATVNDKNPLYSKFYFTQNTDTPEDGTLHTSEIYNTPMNADLAVLSACNTGYGQIAQGEGVMSLARGFSYAGCPSVLMSLWSVHDKATADIITQFYRQLAKGVPKDKALREAKLAYLEQADDFLSHPFYWAGLTLIGDADPVSLNAGIGINYIILAVLLVAGFIFLFFRRKLMRRKRV